MSDTPRTDAEVARVLAQLAADDSTEDHASYVLDQMAGLCRELEREVAEARALAIAEAARIVDHILREGGGTYGDAIRALSPAPSVTEEWVEHVATGEGLFMREHCDSEIELVRATLAALGVEVK